jgi:hypothetical protein
MNLDERSIRSTLLDQSEFDSVCLDRPILYLGNVKQHYIPK